ncbi:MAG: hypothetical protein ACOX9B_10695 [Candidatus Xenobium sp.]|jgi:hypothetical protein
MNIQSNPAVSPQVKGMTEVNVPLQVPRDMLVADPKTGRMPIDDFQVQLLPKDAVITNQLEVQKLVAQVKDETLPEGMRPKIGDSPAGRKVARAKNAVSNVGQMAGRFGASSLAGWGIWKIPATIAGQLSGIGGAIGVLAGADQLKEALDTKHFYEGLKAKGTENVPMQGLVRNEEGKLVDGVRDVPVDEIIKGARDKAIMSGISIASSGALIAAGLGAPPFVAIGALALGTGAMLFGVRGTLKAIGGKIIEKFKDIFDKNKSAAAGAADQPKEVPSGSPEAKGTKEAAPPAAHTASTPQQTAAVPPSLNDEQIQQASARLQELQAQLMADPSIAGTLQQMQELMPSVIQDPEGAEAAEYFKVEEGLKAHPSAGPVYSEMVELQAALLSDPRVQQMMLEQQVVAG